jgi:hypothetical protein
VLAPFPAGTREFGADPLEAFGGIRDIYDRKTDSDRFPSELVFGGYVGWSSVPGGNMAVNLEWNSSYVNWPLIEAWGGLSASQFQGWAVGRLSVAAAGTYTVSCVGVSSFYIGKRPFRGDVYGLGYGTFSVQLPKSAELLIYVPFGGMEGTSFQCAFADVPSSGSSSLQVLNDHIIPDIVMNYKDPNIFAGRYFGLAVLNLQDRPLRRIQVSSKDVNITNQWYPSLAPNQAGVVNVEVRAESAPRCPGNNFTTISFSLRPDGPSETPLVISIGINCRSWGLPYAFTFLDADKSVQYAATRPPSQSCASLPSCPVLFTFHGAGVYARKDAWVYAYEQQPRSWLLFPTNRRQFGFDWEGPGRVNAWRAFNALLELPGVHERYKSSVVVDPYKIQYAGHSMGGHGCWYISSHAPDRALSVSPAAGWIKMGMYIPFFTRLGDSLVDPELQHLLMSAISMHNTDFYIRNLKGIPLMVRMGALDNNVPPYHLKRMARLHNQLAHNATSTEISEIPGESHWWGGVVDDPIMQKFFNRHWNNKLPSLPSSFTLSALSPIDFESRGGIKLLQFILPGKAARIHVSGAQSSDWTLITTNVQRFTFISMPTLAKPTTIKLDGKFFSFLPSLPVHFCFPDAGWMICQDDEWQKTEKHSENYGPIPQILEGPLSIIIGTQSSLYRPMFEDTALMLANTLYYQGRYTPVILTDVEASKDAIPDSNLIILGGPKVNSFAAEFQKTQSLPVAWSSSGFAIGNREFTHPDSGLAFITNIKTLSKRLALFVDGNTPTAANSASSLIPTKSSWTVPDWAVTGPEFGWNGAAGLLGAGYWNNYWRYDARISWMSPFDEF